MCNDCCYVALVCSNLYDIKLVQKIKTENVVCAIQKCGTHF